MVFNHRFKDRRGGYDAVKVYSYELRRLRVDGPLLYSLRSKGEIWYDNHGNFKPMMKDGPIDPKILDAGKRFPKTKAPLSLLHLFMREQLLHVRLAEEMLADASVYFKAFLQHREDSLAMFFTVDGFSGRVHTPIVNLKHDLRMHLTLKGEAVASLDVKQMQPTILAEILKKNIGPNPFSDTVARGDDVYLLLLKQNKELHSRGEAKKFLFQLIFGLPMDDIGRMFEGNTHWVEWINRYKSRPEPRNPHGRDTHTNLAWLLQHSEVHVMTIIWNKLYERGIPFLTIHDDILCRRSDVDTVHGVMVEILKEHFPKFVIKVS